MRAGIRLAAAAVAAAALGASFPVPAQAATEPAPTLHVAPRNAGVLAQGAGLDVDIAITNTASAPLPAATVRVSLGRPPVVGVDTLVDQVEHPTSVLQGYQVASTTSPVVAPGDTVALHLRLAPDVVDSVIDDTAGTRLLGADLAVGTRRAVAIAYSAVTRIPKGFSGRVGFATAVPLTAPANTTGLVPAAQLSTLTDPGAAWHRAVDAAAADPRATVMLDPEVLASIRLAGAAAPASATGLLDRLGSLPNEVVRLPYADGDVTLQRAAGASKVLAPTSFAGGAVSGPAPGATPGPTSSPTPSASPSPAATAPPSDADPLRWEYASTGVAWPVPGTVSGGVLPFLAASGYPVTMLSSTDVKDTETRRAAGPHARVGSSSVLVADATASRLLAAAASGSGIAEDSALAELVGVLGTDAVTHETTAVLAVPPRTGGAPELARVLGRIAALHWVSGTSLGTLSRTTSAAPVQLRRGPVPSAREVPARAAFDAEQEVQQLGSAIRTRADRLTGPQRLALLGVLSAAWRSPQPGWLTAVETVTTGFRAFVHNVRIDRLSDINYVGGSGSLPVTVTNQLDAPVEVVLSGTASNGRLHIEGDEVVDIPAQGGAKAKLPVKSISNGDVAVTLTLRTKDGHVIGRPSTVHITVNAGWEAIGAVVFVSATLALFATGVYRNVRRARRRSRGRT